MDLELKNGLMDLGLKVSLYKVRKTEKDILLGLMAARIKVLFKMASLTEKESMNGEMAVDMKESGNVVRCIHMES